MVRTYVRFQIFWRNYPNMTFASFKMLDEFFKYLILTYTKIGILPTQAWKSFFKLCMALQINCLNPIELYLRQYNLIFSKKIQINSIRVIKFVTVKISQNKICKIKKWFAFWNSVLFFSCWVLTFAARYIFLWNSIVLVEARLREILLVSKWQ